MSEKYNVFHVNCSCIKYARLIHFFREQTSQCTTDLLRSRNSHLVYLTSTTDVVFHLIFITLQQVELYVILLWTLLKHTGVCLKSSPRAKQGCRSLRGLCSRKINLCVTLVVFSTSESTNTINYGHQHITTANSLFL